MGPLETDRHGHSPSCITVAHGGRSYRKSPQMKIATKPVRLPRAVIAHDEQAFAVCRLRELELWKDQIAEQLGHACRDDKAFDEPPRLLRRIGFAQLHHGLDGLELNEVSVFHATSPPGVP